MSTVVLAGGRSSEHDVSLASARSVSQSLRGNGHDVIDVLIGRDGRWTRDGEPVALAPCVDGPALVDLRDGGRTPVSLVFPVLHGPFGEDGTVQGLCETVGVAYAGAGVAASAIAMDKVTFKAFMGQAGIPGVEHVAIDSQDWRGGVSIPERVARELGYPCFVKPASLGSSVGITRVSEPKDLRVAVETALAYGPRAIVERGVSGREIEVGVLGNDELVVSPPGEIEYDAEWYDYTTKYSPGLMRLSVPADLDDETAAEARALAAETYRAINCRGMARVDLFLEGGKLLVSELNTIPGFTPTSVYASLMEQAGIGYAELIDRIAALATETARAAAEYRA